MDLSKLPIIVFHLLVVWISAVRAEIRCYCNLPACVATGYMCKAHHGACFSRIANELDIAKSHHGCSGMLADPQERETCVHLNGSKAKDGGEGKWPMVLCCKEDMCNYIDNVDIRIQVNTTRDGNLYIKGDNSQHGSQARHKAEIDPNELWFKAAVIAVPIAGACILVMLILLAVRMLRKDSRRHMRLLQLRQQRAQLFVGEHIDFFPEKNETNAKLNTRQNNICGGKHVNMSSGSSTTLKSCASSTTQDSKPVNTNHLNNVYTSVIIWGTDLEKADPHPPTPV
ncbi:PREDICTED: BMP and activin membrane-bound inhibitor homolog [Priapulus caudatus]|uniref:BMP and activin membrane-bound inhibitor homolog n=1 Tax=Priapulus caudatus TaxID=37621 RepID=A0ABM1F0R6_PRICU|nr:PREDICTED: BMP and activin membrane-bound inhibitor homolog [Priapulus caudatus]